MPNWPAAVAGWRNVTERFRARRVGCGGVNSGPGAVARAVVAGGGGGAGGRPAAAVPTVVPAGLIDLLIDSYYLFALIDHSYE
ncbi:hypothetical protein GCM10010441_00480 [Kitasatospora paracochleata]